MPDFDLPYPYGLADSRVTPGKLRHALGLPLTILLAPAAVRYLLPD